MVLRVFIPMPQGGSRKGGTFGAWFSELAKKELCPKRIKAVLTPFPFRNESYLFGASLLKVAQDSHRQQISQYVSKGNMQSFRHGRGWLTVRENETEESTLGQVGVDLVIKYLSIIDNDIKSLFEFVSNFVEGFTSQVISQMFQAISDACDKSGNVVKQSDYSSKAEAFLEMLNTIEFSVNENGQVELPHLHVGPDEGKALIDELNEQGNEFHKEVERIMKEKSEAAIEKEKARLSKYKAINL